MSGLLTRDSAIADGRGSTVRVGAATISATSQTTRNAASTPNATRPGCDRRARRMHGSGSLSAAPPKSASLTSLTSSKNAVVRWTSGGRGLGRSIGTSPQMRPGRGDITSTRSDRKTASARLCVMSIAVVSLSDQMRSSSLFIRRRVISSSAPNGSSRSSTRGTKHERPGDGGALAHPARQLAGPRVLEALEPHELDEVAGDRAAVAVSDRAPRDLEGQRHVAEHVPPREEARVLEHDAHLAATTGVAGAHAVDLDQAIGRLVDIGDEAEQGRLAAAGGPDDRDELAGRDGERDVLEGRERPAVEVEALGDALDQDDRGRRRRSGRVGRRLGGHQGIERAIITPGGCSRHPSPPPGWRWSSRRRPRRR